MKKTNLKRGNLVVYWKNWVAEGAIFLQWLDERTAKLMLGDGSEIEVNGSTFDVAAR